MINALVVATTRLRQNTAQCRPGAKKTAGSPAVSDVYPSDDADASISVNAFDIDLGHGIAPVTVSGDEVADAVDTGVDVYVAFAAGIR